MFVVMVGRFLPLVVRTGQSLLVSRVGRRGGLMSQVCHQSCLASPVGRHGILKSRVLYRVELISWTVVSDRYTLVMVDR